MVVKRKIEKDTSIDIEKIINAGGKTVAETISLQYSTVCFNLRLPRGLVEKIDKKRKSMIGTVSRNQWIIEALAKIVDQN
jgi:hypothetical protein